MTATILQFKPRPRHSLDYPNEGDDWRVSPRHFNPNYALIGGILFCAFFWVAVFTTIEMAWSR